MSKKTIAEVLAMPIETFEQLEQFHAEASLLLSAAESAINLLDAAWDRARTRRALRALYRLIGLKVNWRNR